jgi:hypothetical protein
VDPVQSIAELAIQHLKTKPAQTLGIIAFKKTNAKKFVKNSKTRLKILFIEKSI